MIFVYLVSMGIGWNGVQSTVKVFSCLEAANNFVIRQFEDAILDLKNTTEYFGQQSGVQIGNTFHIEKIELEEVKAVRK